MKKHTYHLAILIYLLTIINLSLIFLEIYISHLVIKLVYLFLILFLFFMIAKNHFETSLQSPYTTWKDKASMNIDEYLEPILSNKETNKPDEIKLIVMLTAILSFTIFIWKMVYSPNGDPIVKKGEYFSQNHEIFTSISKEEYYELLRIEHMFLAIFPLILSTIGIWKFYQYKNKV